MDSSYIGHVLVKKGYKIADSIEEADRVILNTCAFIQDAIRESISEYKRIKALGKEVIVTGCLPERFRGILPMQAQFVRLDDIENIDEVLSHRYNPRFAIKQKFLYNGERLLDGHLPYAYVKIQEGCSRKCAFCTIPSIRGKSRSRGIDSVVSEVMRLVEHGKREIILVGEDLTMYSPGLLILLEKLSEIEKLSLIRLLYLHPQGVTRRLVKEIAQMSKVARYFHIPMQHISDKVLSSMKRAGGEHAVRKAVDMVRAFIPEAFIRTEVIVGYPTETERDFNFLLEFLEDRKIERIGIFKYSREPGTSSFYLGELPGNIVSDRFERANCLSDILMRNAQEKLVGKKVRVIAEKDGGRTEYDAPLVDFSVHFKYSSPAYGKVKRLKVKAISENQVVV